MKGWIEVTNLYVSTNDKSETLQKRTMLIPISAYTFYEYGMRRNGKPEIRCIADPISDGESIVLQETYDQIKALITTATE